MRPSVWWIYSPPDASFSSSEGQQVAESGEAWEEEERPTEENIFCVGGEVVVSSGDCEGQTSDKVANIKHSETLENPSGQLPHSGVILHAVDC